MWLTRYARTIYGKLRPAVVLALTDRGRLDIRIRQGINPPFAELSSMNEHLTELLAAKRIADKEAIMLRYPDLLTEEAEVALASLLCMGDPCFGKADPTPEEQIRIARVFNSAQTYLEILRMCRYEGVQRAFEQVRYRDS
jgi:hypothetical protein